MKVNKAVIKKAEVSAAMLKVFDYTAKMYPASDRRFEMDRKEIKGARSDAIFDTVAGCLRGGVGYKMQANLKEMTMEMVVSDEVIKGTPMTIILSRPMTNIEAFEAAQAQRVLSD